MRVFAATSAAILTFVALVSSADRPADGSIEEAASARTSRVMKSMDANGDNNLSKEEFTVVSGKEISGAKKRWGLTEPEYQVLLKRFDLDGDGLWSMKELGSVFNTMDVDDNEMVSRDELFDAVLDHFKRMGAQTRGDQTKA